MTCSISTPPGGCASSSPARPNASGAPVSPALRRFLNAQGQANLAHPDASTWTAADALAPIAWLTGTADHAGLTGRRIRTEPAWAKYKVMARVAPGGREEPGATVRVAVAGGDEPPDRPGTSSGP